MCKRIMSGAADEDITDELVKWKNAGGKALVGLMRRRCAEANMFLGRERYKVVNNQIKKV
jgi:GH24 family phage-related lysozyme (muramidase)